MVGILSQDLEYVIFQIGAAIHNTTLRLYRSKTCPMGSSHLILFVSLKSSVKLVLSTTKLFSYRKEECKYPNPGSKKQNNKKTTKNPNQILTQKRLNH